MRIITDLMR